MLDLKYYKKKIFDIIDILEEKTMLFKFSFAIFVCCATIGLSAIFGEYIGCDNIVEHVLVGILFCCVLFCCILICAIVQIYFDCKNDPKINTGSTILHTLILCTTRDVFLDKIFYMMMKILLIFSNDVNLADNKKYTPLHFVICNMSEQMGSESSTGLKIVQLLINYGANVNALDIRGRTPLVMFGRYPPHRCVELLLRNNADVNARNKRGNTILHNIMYMGPTKSVETFTKFLINHGADIHAKNNSGISPYNIACEKRFYGPVSLVLEHANKLILETLNSLHDDKNSFLYKEYFCDDVFHKLLEFL